MDRNERYRNTKKYDKHSQLVMQNNSTSTCMGCKQSNIQDSLAYSTYYYFNLSIDFDRL